MATQQGEQAIGTLKVGEKVWSYNPTTKKMELQPILHVWINHDNDMVDLTITKTMKGKATKPISEVLHTNKKHPFLTVEKGFLSVGQMKLEMDVVEADGDLGVISGWKVVLGVMTMYNLEVAQDHMFTVGIGQWVVHNCARIPEYSANGDPELRALRRPEFDNWQSDGLEMNGDTYGLSEHAYNSLFKSGRKDIMPSDIIAALSEEPRPGTPGSVEYVNPKTGTSVFVNPQTHKIIGIWPGTFKR